MVVTFFVVISALLSPACRARIGSYVIVIGKMYHHPGENPGVVVNFSTRSFHYFTQRVGKIRSTSRTPLLQREMTRTNS